MYGQYDVTGRLIVVPMEGNGDYSILCSKYLQKRHLTQNVITLTQSLYYIWGET